MRTTLVAGNWKMNGDSAASRKLVEGILAGLAADAAAEVLVCPPFPYLAAVAAELRSTPIALGAQNVSEHGAGAYTGEVSAGMLVDLGCRYVIVGHSERRSLYGETNGQVAAKAAAALGAGLVPVICVGETLAEREAGRTETVVSEQLDAVIAACGAEGLARSVLAYEPVWAIGTGRVATPEQAQDVHAHIRQQVAASDETVAADLRILYGGSMKGENAPGLLAMPDIDGGLIGGASLKADDFLAIIAAAGTN
ncbi:MAG TPA: triose-phosphate isomerase [Woeseiaceae bacterium]|nr:triose-phosphate isomerase [Woeseiaceae bacterium]